MNSYIPPRLSRSYMPRITWRHRESRNGGDLWHGPIRGSDPAERFTIYFNPEEQPDPSPYRMFIARESDAMSDYHFVGNYPTLDDAQTAALEWVENIDARRAQQW